MVSAKIRLIHPSSWFHRDNDQRSWLNLSEGVSTRCPAPPWLPQKLSPESSSIPSPSVGIPLLPVCSLRAVLLYNGSRTPICAISRQPDVSWLGHWEEPLQPQEQAGGPGVPCHPRSPSISSLS